MRCPALVMQGIGPSAWPTTPGDEVAAAMVNARLVKIKEGGHLVAMEAPHKVSEAIADFLV